MRLLDTHQEMDCSSEHSTVQRTLGEEQQAHALEEVWQQVSSSGQKEEEPWQGTSSSSSELSRVRWGRNRACGSTTRVKGMVSH